MLDTIELLGHGAKLRHAVIGDKVVAYEQTERKIVVFDRIGKSGETTVTKFDTNLDLLVTALAYEHPTVAYIHGSQAVLLNIETREQVVVNQPAKLSAVALSNDGTKVAIADTVGRITLCTVKQPPALTSLPHWHAFAVNCLHFTEEGDLISAGHEAVLVHWWLKRQERTFIARVGRGVITGLTTNDEFIAMTMGNNQLKMLRVDSGKSVIDVTGVQGQLTTHGNKAIWQDGSRLLVKETLDMTMKSPGARVIETNPRNFVHLEKPGPGYKIMSHAIDKKQKYLVTVEMLADMPRDNSEICLAYLKVWNFEKANLLQIISLNAEAANKFCVSFIDADCFMLTVK